MNGLKSLSLEWVGLAQLLSVSHNRVPPLCYDAQERPVGAIVLDFHISMKQMSVLYKLLSLRCFVIIMRNRPRYHTTQPFACTSLSGPRGI